jgi:tyrosinase
VRQTVADLGGPDNWALPYWDYSDPGRPDVRKRPPAFRDSQTPSGERNPLLVERSGMAPGVNEGAELDELDVSVEAAMAEQFSPGQAGPRSSAAPPQHGTTSGGRSVRWRVRPTATSI